MPALPPHMSLDRLRELTLAAHPEFSGARFTALADGWDSVALDIDGEFIVKFPREADAEAALRREVALLSVIAPRVTMPVPAMKLFEAPVPHTLHAKLKGISLDPEAYAKTSEATRSTIGEQLGLFYAELHAIDSGLFRTAGAQPVEAWFDAPTIRDRAMPLLPPDLRAWADRALDLWANLPPDPYGVTYGFFDGHGWNLAFDPQHGRLNGVFDFGDSGFGPLHQEFIYSNLIAPDVTARIVTSYERHTGRKLDRERILLLSDIHRLWEIAVECEDSESVAIMLAEARSWVERRA